MARIYSELLESIDAHAGLQRAVLHYNFPRLAQTLDTAPQSSTHFPIARKDGVMANRTDGGQVNRRF
jgi:hypothetical protein